MTTLASILPPPSRSGQTGPGCSLPSPLSSPLLLLLHTCLHDVFVCSRCLRVRSPPAHRVLCSLSFPLPPSLPLPLSCFLSLSLVLSPSPSTIMQCQCNSHVIACLPCSVGAMQPLQWHSCGCGCGTSRVGVNGVGVDPCSAMP